jgi:peptide/nickel transport system substrate-binding protein
MRPTRLIAAASLTAGAAVVLALLLPGADARATSTQQGGTFRIVHAGDSPVDPAFFTLLGNPLSRASCALLVNYADKPSPAGLRLVPDAAAAMPKVSRDGKTYTFTIRRGLRFSGGAPVTAENFARAFARVFAPSMKSDWAGYAREEIVGAKKVRDGEVPAGVVARGNRLVIRLTRPVPDLPYRLALTGFCAVPRNLPIDREGVGAPLHSAGPYYVSEYVRGRRIVLSRNPHYRGSRPQRVERILVDLTAASSIEALNTVRAGQADWTPFYDRAQFSKVGELARAYGLNKSRLFVKPGFYLVGFYLNSKGRLFRDNVRLRRAVNFAVDRPALLAQVGSAVGGVTDQYLSPAARGFRDARIYPLRGPNVTRARALARGRLRSKRVALYISDDPVLSAQAQILKKNLAAIGLEVTVTQRPAGVHVKKLFTAKEPWDIASYPWIADYPDPGQYLNPLFEGRSGDNPGFDSPRFNRLLAKAALLRGAARYRAYGKLDARLARDAAPYVAVHYANEPTLVSSRVRPSCVILNPVLDIAAVCLK